MMRILMVHSHYRERGGEDVVYDLEKNMLIEAGHQVICYERDSNDIDISSFLNRVRLFFSTIWSQQSYREIKALVRDHEPDIIYVHNTFPLVSPSVYYVTKRIPILKRLPNFRPLCLAMTFFREGSVCEDCLGKRLPWPGLYHRCYGDSFAGSLGLFCLIAVHRLLRTYDKRVDLFITPTEFVRQKYLQAGWLEKKVATKPNFVDYEGPVSEGKGVHALYIGRLSPEKGVFTLLRAWQELPDIPLKIIGTGPLADEAREFFASHDMNHIQMMGFMNREEIFRLLRESAFLVFPSGCYESFGIAIIEAYAAGVPVIASRMGGPGQIVIDGITGLHFAPGDEHDLALKARRLWQDSDLRRSMGASARDSYDKHYTREVNYQKFMQLLSAIPGVRN